MPQPSLVEGTHEPTVSAPRYSVAIPTYNRPDVLEQCLESIAALDYPLEQIEVVIVDNGGQQQTRDVVQRFEHILKLSHYVNDVNRGLGYSLNRSFRLSNGQRIVSMNDDVLLPASYMRDLDSTFDRDPQIGCVGCRAIEAGYVRCGSGVGHISPDGQVVGNFDEGGNEPVEVEHVYGFCYAFTREALEQAGPCDETLLAQPYSSGNRIETDHCLTIRKLGLKVIYNPRIAAQHLAKPRGDISERSLAWKRDDIRNTLYLFLKHYGLFGRNCVALRFAFRDVGIRSALLRPSLRNWLYVANGARARASAIGHYCRYLLGFR